jgi:hypothetical protein
VDEVGATEWWREGATVVSIQVWKFVRASRVATAITILLFLMIAAPVSAQSSESAGDNNSFWNISKSVLLDPTTYAPAGISYTATRLDWNTSQPFFARGFIERNPRFTITGLPNDVPLSHADGNKRILTDTLMYHADVCRAQSRAFSLWSVCSSRRIRKHRKIIKTIGWNRTGRVRIVLVVPPVRRTLATVAGKSNQDAAAMTSDKNSLVPWALGLVSASSWCLVPGSQIRRAPGTWTKHQALRTGQAQAPRTKAQSKLRFVSRRRPGV